MTDLDVEKWTDEQLLKAINHGQIAAEALYQRYSSYAIKLAARLLRDTAQAEEVAHDAWLAVHHRLKKYGPIAEFKPYITVVIVNRCRKILAKRVATLSLDADVSERLEESESHCLSADENIPLEVEQEHLLASINRCIEELPAKESLAVKLRYFDEYSYAEIANFLGKTEGHARLITHRAVNALRKKLGDAKNI